MKNHEATMIMLTDDELVVLKQTSAKDVTGRRATLLVILRESAGPGVADFRRLIVGERIFNEQGERGIGNLLLA
jgi:hypothetical protein